MRVKHPFKGWHVGTGRYQTGWLGSGKVKVNKYKPDKFPLSAKRRARNVKLVEAASVGTFKPVYPTIEEMFVEGMPFRPKHYIRNLPSLNHTGTGRNPQTQPTLLLDKKLARAIRQERRVRSTKHG